MFCDGCGDDGGGGSGRSDFGVGGGGVSGGVLGSYLGTCCIWNRQTYYATSQICQGLMSEVVSTFDGV